MAKRHVRGELRPRALNTRAFEKRAVSRDHATVGQRTHVSATTRRPVSWVWTRRDRAICPPLWSSLTANARHFSHFRRTRGYR